MAHQLLATFYVRSQDYPDLALTEVTAKVQVYSGGTWASDSTMTTSTGTGSGNFYIEITSAPHVNYDHRYRIDVMRRDVSVGAITMPGVTPEEKFGIYKAGTYERKLVISFKGVDVLTRMLYITIQPDLTVTVGETDLVTTSRTNTDSNPANHSVTVNVNAPIDDINLISTNDYKDTLSIKTNLPIDVFCEYFTIETESGGMMMSASTWLRLAEKIRMTRKIGNTESQWTAGTPPMGASPITENTVRFITDPNLYTEVELGLEKPPLLLPLKVEAEMELRGLFAERYTGIGTTKSNTPIIVLPLTVILKTPHAITITPKILTLDEDNSYTSFVTIEANDEATWTLATETAKLTVTPSSGTGRAAVVVKKAASHTLGSAFESVTLTATSQVNSSTFPDIDGLYTATGSTKVHLEKYQPTKNALIPKMTGNSNITNAPKLDTWKSFDNTLTNHGTAASWDSGNTFDVNNFDPTSFPTIEIPFTPSHRVRSWSLQSVGAIPSPQGLPAPPSEPWATKLVLSGKGLDNEWKILDCTQTLTGSNFYANTKPRIDRKVHHRELVSVIRITAVEVHQSSMSGVSTDPVLFPQIQVFSGEPVMPKMTTSNTSNNGVTIYSKDNSNVYRLFDQEVNGSSIASVGVWEWYINTQSYLRNNVAKNGTALDVVTGIFASLSWVAIIFPRASLLGYLYSIDNLEGSNQNAITPYAASLLFEGRSESDPNQNSQASGVGNWQKIAQISLDHCIGYTDDTTTASLIASPQTTLNTWAGNLGLTGSDNAFLTNYSDGKTIRYEGASSTWKDDGVRLKPGSTHEFNNNTTPQLLENDQSTLNAVALTRVSPIPDKATIVNQVDAKRLMYDLGTKKWSEVPNHDAIYRVHNQTHYKDLIGDPLLKLEQMRFSVQSMMNSEKATSDSHNIAMPEMQFFGLPAEVINEDDVATVSYLKAEDAGGKLHDILGRHQRLPHYSYDSSYGGSTKFRFYISEVLHIKSSDKKLYLAVQGSNGSMGTPVSTDLTIAKESYDISPSGDHRTQATYYELYIFTNSNEKIIVSSGYTGDGR